MVYLEFLYTKFFMLKVKIDFLSYFSSLRISLDSLLIYWFDSKANILSFMNSSN